MDRGLVDSCVRSAIRQAEGTVALAPRQKEYIKMKTLYKNMNNHVFAFRPSVREMIQKSICKVIEAVLLVTISIPLSLYLIWLVFA